MKTIDTSRHPCFSIDAAHAFARLHLPVAPRCNIKCAYCNRKFDCVNESRPGVTSSVLSPQEGLERFRRMKETFPSLSIVGVAGPGDALANPEATFETFRLIREEDKEVEFCLSTNGVALVEHLEEITSVGVKFITVTVNSRRLDVAGTLYAWAEDGDVVLKGQDAAALVMKRQEEALDALKELDVHVKVNVVYIPGVNDHEVEEIVRFAKEKGADIVNIMPFIPTPGTYFENFPMVSRETLRKVQAKMSAILPQMRHCAQCRADAVGTVLNEKPVFVDRTEVKELSACARAGHDSTPEGEAFRFAVASKTGYLVDLHFGHAGEFLIYDASGAAIRFIERREMNKYCDGKESCDSPEERLAQTLDKLSDCHAVLAMRIGDGPRRGLAERGIHVSMTCNRIEDAIRENYGALCARNERGAMESQ